MNNSSGNSHLLKLSSSPHLHSKLNAKSVMWLVILSLLPSLVSGILFFGIEQIKVISVSIAFCLLTEASIKLIRKQKLTVFDGSAFLTGLLLGLILPPNFSLSSAAIGAVTAIGIGKEIFGGLGFNIFNPALVGRAFLQAAFPVAMTTWTKPNFAVDSVTSATPLSAFKFDKMISDQSAMFWGNVSGSLGETSAAAILIGGAYLIAMRIINWRIPVSMIAGILIFGGIFFIIDPAKYPNPFFHLFAGGFLFGTFFMATDWVTSPITSKGMWVFGIGISFIVVLIRIFGGLPEGVMYAILIMNSTVPMINRYTVPKLFGATA